MSKEYGGYWQRRYVENRAGWLLASGSLDFDVVRRRAAQAEAVLRAIGVAVPSVTKANAAALLAELTGSHDVGDIAA